MVRVLNPSIWEAEAVDLCELESNLVYRVSSRTVSTHQTNKQKQKIKGDRRETRETQSG